MSAYTLSKEEVLRYADQGYWGPFTLCSPEEMSVIRKRIEEEVLVTVPPFHSTLNESKFQSRHLHLRIVYDICSHPAVNDRMSSIFGRKPGPVAIEFLYEGFRGIRTPTIGRSRFRLGSRLTKP